MTAAGQVLGLEFLTPEPVQVDPTHEFAATGRTKPPPTGRKIEVPLPLLFLAKLTVFCLPQMGRRRS